MSKISEDYGFVNPKHKKKVVRKPPKKCDHKHKYQQVHIVEISKKNFSINSLGERCEICGKVVPVKMFLFEPVPEWVLKLDRVIIER